MAEAATAQVGGAGGAEPKLKIDKFADGPVTCLKFIGTIDEQFDGKKIATTLKGGTLVLDLADISKISSFGIREWVDFINNVGSRVDAIYLIECAPKVVDQLNMVANFSGKGRVFSFYAPYRCDYCDADRRVLLQADRDFDAIKGMKPPERPCTNCGNPEYFDEDPTSFFSYLAAQQKFELDPTVAGFLASKLNYAVSDAARRLRVEKHIEGRSVYLKIAGDLDGSFPREKLAEGMEGTLALDVTGIGKVDPAGAAEWRGFLTMITPTCEKILLIGAPPVFLERLTKPEDLGAKAQVMSFAMPYSCAKCATTASQLVDVETHFDVLKFATPPEMKCVDCKGPTTCAASEGLLSHLPTLPKPVIEPALRKFIKEVQEKKPEKAPSVATTMAAAAAAGRRSSFVTIIVAVAAAAAVAAGVVFYMNYQKQKEAEKKKAGRDAVGAVKQQSPGDKPAWITSDERFSAVCTAEGGGFSCVGVSSYSDTEADADAEANDAALEELANSIGDKIDEPMFSESVRKVYGESRNLALTGFLKVKTETDGGAYDRARRAVKEGRTAVAAVLLKNGLVKPSPNDRYWAEYEPLYGTGSRWLVYARFTVSEDTVKQLIAQYATTTEAQGAKVMSLFPSVAWRYPDVSAGAIVVAVAKGAIGSSGLQPGNVVVEVDGKNVTDGASFARMATAQVEAVKTLQCSKAQRNASLPLRVKLDDRQPQSFLATLECPPLPKEADPIRIRPPNNGNNGKDPNGVNIWDNTGGGGGGRDNPND